MKAIVGLIGVSIVLLTGNGIFINLLVKRRKKYKELKKTYEEQKKKNEEWNKKQSETTKEIQKVHLAGSDADKLNASIELLNKIAGRN